MISSLKTAWFLGYPCFHEISLSGSTGSLQLPLGSSQQLEQQGHSNSLLEQSLVKTSNFSGTSLQIGLASPVSMLSSNRTIPRVKRTSLQKRIRGVRVMDYASLISGGQNAWYKIIHLLK